MARKWTNENIPGALHFVTGNIFNRKPIFRSEKNCIAFLEELQILRADRECKLLAFVLMPDHFHLTLNPRDGAIQTSTGILKSLSAKRLVDLAPSKYFWNGKENQVWQEGFKALALWSGWMIRQKIDYIHANPVRANLAKSAEDYRWTSFRAFYFEESDPLLQVDKVCWWPEDVEKLTSAMAERQAAADAKFNEWREAKVSGGKPPS